MKTYFEFVAELCFAEEDPLVSILPVPSQLELLHALDNAVKFFVAHEADYCSPRAR